MTFEELIKSKLNTSEETKRVYFRLKTNQPNHIYFFYTRVYPQIWNESVIGLNSMFSNSTFFFSLQDEVIEIDIQPVLDLLANHFNQETL